ncbi:unannotated protein [freshwater metagenome]|uniref:Unannotated protein n=1 Tax=freshwater metagenome TaxID=449393 RepID=A0A6J7BFH3_9ZZZZ
MQLFGGEPPPFQSSRTKILDEHVARGNKFLCDLGATWISEVESDRAFVAREHGPPEWNAIFARSVIANRIAFRGMFHLDDVGAEVAEDGGRHGTGKEGRQIENSHAG